MIGIVVSEADIASTHIGSELRAARDWTVRVDEQRPESDGGGTYHVDTPFSLRTFEGLHLDLDGVASVFANPTLIVFASRHSADTGPLLTAHFTGNVGTAKFGGAENQLAIAAPNALAVVHEALEEFVPSGYEVGIEATHHGPSSVGAPSMFVELGSNPAQWEDPSGAHAVARAILALERWVAPSPAMPNEFAGTGSAAQEGKSDETAGPPTQSERKTRPAREWPPEPISDESTPNTDGLTQNRVLTGFGGGHYANRFERILDETDWAIGHIAPRWALEELDDLQAHQETIRQVFSRSGATHALVEGEMPSLVDVIEEIGCRVVDETWVREVDGVALSFVYDAEETLKPVDQGLRFGNLAPGPSDGSSRRSEEGSAVVASLPNEVIAECLGIDANAVRSAVRETTLAFETEEAGTRPHGRAVFSEAQTQAELIDRLVAVLRTSYESVTRQPDAIVVTEEAFDPQRARDRGVPDGPAFGKLAAGEPIEVDGTTVSPDTVTETRTHRFQLPMEYRTTGDESG